MSSTPSSVALRLAASPSRPNTKSRISNNHTQLSIKDETLTDRALERLLECSHLTLENCILKPKHFRVLTQSLKNYLEFSNCTLRSKDSGSVPIPDTQLIERHGVMTKLEEFDDEIPASLTKELNAADTPSLKIEKEETPIMDPKVTKLIEAYKKQQIKERENKLTKYIEFGEALRDLAQNYIALLIERIPSFTSVEPSLNPLEAGKIQLQQCLHEVEKVIRSHKDKSSSVDYLLNIGGVAIQNLVNMLNDMNNTRGFSIVTSYVYTEEGLLVIDPKFDLFSLLSKCRCPEIEEINLPRHYAK